MSLRDTLRGTGVALITPFGADTSVDYGALATVIDHVIAVVVEYVVTLGTTGETPTLSKEEKKQIALFTYEKVAGRVPVVVGIGGSNTAELMHELATFPLDKAVAVLSASPSYSKPSQEGLFQHYKALAAASPKPVILYNVPGRTGRNLNAATTIRLAKEVRNIAGIKEASGDMAQCMEILRDKPEEFLVVSGDDALALPQIACGMEGVISVAANAFPKEFSQMVGVYNSAKGPKGLLALEGADHVAWLAPSSKWFNSAVETTTDFFDAYLRGDTLALNRIVGDGQPGVSRVYFAPSPGSTTTIATVPQPKTHLRATVSPTTNLTDGQSVTVDWSGFQPGKVVNIVECSSASATGCNISGGHILTPDPTGTGTVSLRIVAGRVGSGLCDAAHPGCEVLVNDAGLETPTATIRIPITFAP